MGIFHIKNRRGIPGGRARNRNGNDFAKSQQIRGRFSNFIYSGEYKNPTVAEMREKIIMLARFDPYSLYHGWNNCIVEDHWENNTTKNKIDQGKESLNNGRAGNQKWMYLTFTNYTGGGKLVKITSNGINPEVYNNVRNSPDRLGMIAMNHTGPKLIRDIINHNFSIYCVL